MRIEVDPARLLEAFQRDWPLQAEITVLRVANEELQARIGELEQHPPLHDEQ